MGCAEAMSCWDIVFEFVQLFLVDIEAALNLCLQVATINNICKQFGPRSSPTKLWVDLDSNCLTLC